ncbi:MAG: AmmeMemoRadiSam system protein B [bacterium]
MKRYLWLFLGLCFICSCEQKVSKEMSEAVEVSGTSSAPDTKLTKKEGKKMESKVIRGPVVAGMFYPGDKAVLREDVDDFLANVEPEKGIERVLAVLVPHAGYTYSGQVAAYSFKQLKGRDIKRVILVGPSHHVAFSGISIEPEGAYETPLGLVPIDEGLAEEWMGESEEVRFYPPAHVKEHALEVELPFLQRILTDFSILPVIIGSHSYETAVTLSRLLVKALSDKQTVLVVSADLSHYHPYGEAVRLDRAGLEAIENLDVETFANRVNKGETEIDAPGAIMAMILTANSMAPTQVKLLKYANSGDVTGDRSRGVVGYAALMITKRPAQTEEKADDQAKADENLQEDLLKLARHTIETYVREGQMPPFEAKGNQELLEHRGAFVTIHKHGQLRGCIGYIEPIYPLYKAIMQAAVSAATRDHRFPPLSPDELSEIDLEISILTPPKRISDVNEIKVGRDGLIMKKGHYQGLLLPQVATEYNWDRETFLEHTCLKAGLPKDSWKDKGVEIYTFMAQVLGEKP